MKKFKHGFTIAEILLCLVIVGIITVITMKTIKTVADSYTVISYHALKNVKLIVRELRNVNQESPLLDLNNNNRDERDLFMKCALNSGATADIIKPDFRGYLSNCQKDGNKAKCKYFATTEATTSTDKRLDTDTPNHKSNYPSCALTDGNFGTPDDDFNFCARIASMANTKGDINCKSADLKEVGSDGPFTNGDQFYLAIADDNGKNINARPNFIATNGQKYYISKRQLLEDFNGLGFRLIAIDLNGNRGPNLISPNKNAYGIGTELEIPDIITFMVRDDGYVFPLGVAANNKQSGKTINYLNSKVLAKNFNETNNASLDATCLVGADGSVRADGTPASPDDDGSSVPRGGTKQPCKYKLQYIEDNGKKVYSYRRALCIAGLNAGYTNYCTGIGVNGDCGSNKPYFCDVEPVKPLFRFKLDG